jgi:hypothetical protein
LAGCLHSSTAGVASLAFLFSLGFATGVCEFRGAAIYLYTFSIFVRISSAT